MEGKPILLVVDDELDILDYVERVFRKKYLVLRAQDGDQALLELRRAVIGVVITDHRMPGVSGLELLRQVAAEHPDVTRVLLSGFSDLPEITEAVHQGLAHVHVTKPVDSKRLREAVAEAEARREHGDWQRASS